MADVAIAAVARGSPEAVARWVLQKDRWDDFGFKTQYHLFHFGEGPDEFVGNVKILRRGQETSGEGILPVGRSRHWAMTSARWGSRSTTTSVWRRCPPRSGTRS